MAWFEAGMVSMMDWRSLALAACVALAAPAAGGTERPLCDHGTFLVEGAPLLSNPVFSPPDRVILRDGTLALASGCAPVPVDLHANRRGTFLRAHWSECSGLAEGVSLKARIRPGCGRMQGRLRVESPPLVRRFAALREADVLECDVAHSCPEGQLCELPAGVCTRGLDGGTCVPVPQACPDLYAPVCGCDDQTYSNDCERRAAGAQKSYDGACGSCRDACDCDARLEFEHSCPLMCPNCGSFWKCEDGQCVEGCGPVPLSLCEEPCPSGEQETSCGPELRCNCASEVCVRHEPVGPAVVYACEPIPAGCEAERSCDCAGASLCEAPFDTCSQRRSNVLSCECIECQ